MGLKEAYEEKMEARLREWNAKIDVLKAKADRAGAEQKVRYYESIENLRDKQKKLESKLEQLRSSSEMAWEEFRGGVEQAWEELKSAVERAGEKFR